MKEEKKVLFGTDDSDFATEALSEIGVLMKNSEQLSITLFHGASDVEFQSFYKSICHEPDADEKFDNFKTLEGENVLKRAKDTLIKSGIDPNMISTVLEKNCKDPTGFLLNLAEKQKYDTIAVARWGKATVSRQVIGSVPYRISQMANDQTLWVVDHRIGSRDILVGLVGADVSRRVVDYTVRYFSHLRESKFVLFHVIPPVPPQFWQAESSLDLECGHEKQEKIVMWAKEYTDKVKEIGDYAKTKLTKAGVPDKNVIFKINPQKVGIARDIFTELESGNYGILVMGRRGFKDIKDFGLGSKANKLLLKCRGYIVCLVN